MNILNQGSRVTLSNLTRLFLDRTSASLNTSFVPRSLSLLYVKYFLEQKFSYCKFAAVISFKEILRHNYEHVNYSLTAPLTTPPPQVIIVPRTTLQIIC